jgi:chorismate mutase
MESKKYLLVEASAAPDIFLKVLKAKKLLTEGKIRHASEAARAVGISRGAYYKYKDVVFPYHGPEESTIMTVQAILTDKPGVLVSFVSVFYAKGANILTINQNIPVDGMAMVSISARTDSMLYSVDELLGDLSKVSGVRSVDRISNQ